MNFQAIEESIRYEARFKSVEMDEDQKILYWVTQESERADDADDIQAWLDQNGYEDWVVALQVRDYFYGIEETDWIYSEKFYEKI